MKYIVYLLMITMLIVVSSCSSVANPSAKMAVEQSDSAGREAPGMIAEKQKKTSSGSEPRIRQYFPETLLFAPQIITDEYGMATLDLKMADSITTWRVTATANTQSGLLGSTTSSLKVFQDFFVDIDFPVALTQNDEVAVPVAIYNYLPESQNVRLVVTTENWFKLLDEPEKNVTMKAKDVGVVYFRLQALKVGRHRLTIKAYGQTMSDAVRREVEIIPDGEQIEKVINGDLAGSQQHQIIIPKNAIPGASKIIAKCYPGIEATLIEGLDGMLAMPNG